MRSRNSKQVSVCVIGLGYVGLPLALQFSRSDVSVIGVDIDQEKVEQINQGHSYIKHIASEMLRNALKAKLLSASADFSRVAEVNAVIICVPTPLNKNREPDISYILETGRAIAPPLVKGTLVVW